MKIVLLFRILAGALPIASSDRLPRFPSGHVPLHRSPATRSTTLRSMVQFAGGATVWSCTPQESGYQTVVRGRHRSWPQTQTRWPVAMSEAGSVAEERIHTDGGVVEAGGVAKKRGVPKGRFVAAGSATTKGR